jgi:hypothetical protein
MRLCRRHSKPFFSVAPQGDNHRVRVAKESPDPCLGNEAGEPVEVVELLEFGHRQSMTRIPQEEKSVFPRKSRRFMHYQGRKVPTRKPEEPLLGPVDESG